MTATECRGRHTATIGNANLSIIVLHQSRNIAAGSATRLARGLEKKCLLDAAIADN